jgi:NAD(P)-dependent dehydrogenase (short-subunit alcohol dehydrogenase family)
VGWSRCDVADANSVETSAGEALSALGGIDLVVHAAGVSAGALAIEASAENQRWVIDVNLHGTIHVGGSFGRILVSQESSSRIVFTGSEHSLGVPHVGSAVYTASKHGVLGYADVLRRELPAHVAVSVLCPGLVGTDLWRSATRRGEAYGGPETAPQGAESVMAAGMPVEQVAEAVLRGVDAGEFLIVTHGHARRYARERFDHINGAFDRQAPDEHDDRYEVSRVFSDLRRRSRDAEPA